MKESLLSPRRPVVSRLATVGTMIAIFALLSACSMSPGMYMGKPQDVSQALQNEAAPPGALMTISPQLIEQQRASENTEINFDIKRLFGVPTEYRVGPGDILNIVVWNHPELALAMAGSNVATYAPSIADVGNGYNVSTEGYIQFPFVGAIKVADLTEYEIRSLLTRRMAQYISDPQLTVRIQAYRNGRVYVDGEVRNPGLVTMNDIPMTLPEAINRAGGLTADADRSSVVLTRNGVATHINMPLLTRKGVNPAQILMANGDLLRVINRNDSKVFLLGDVHTARAQPLMDGQLTLAQALGEAGGLNPETSNARQVYVIRKGLNGNAEIYHLDASAPTAYVLAADFELKARDMVFVDPAPIVRWNRVISMLLPSYGAISATRDMTR
ncbi:polysaccharide biosynthesis/export family protein [Pollutimonas bauzanensis]|uniref:Polysaccharide export outer membrane protein n=1 Tax=Pollutimonas bauzanensis TaxID=658167 RepID=A0A1M5YXJ6_9BURK|nr:polysaccharide biosynthesis/export family protein [Pollutimonas bauzanensis]SHI16766.1 polysaccharide export outer membrane protein [Pollutimonas bauzanensis]